MSRDADESTMQGANGCAWYLYGVADHRDPRELEGVVDDGLDGRSQVSFLPHGDLAAVTSCVPLSEFGAEAIRARMRDAAWVEAMVRGHQRVVEFVHRQVTILPAKFACVYASTEDLVAQLGRLQDSLLSQIQRLEGCDEWGVRFHAVRSMVRQGGLAADPRAQQLRQELAAARPGRAYFLKRKLEQVLDTITEQTLCDLSQAGYDRLVSRAVAGQIAAGLKMSRIGREEMELLRASFLVSRPAAETFLAELEHFTVGVDGLRCEYSGPWPPYSFVDPPEIGSAPVGSTWDNLFREAQP